MFAVDVQLLFARATRGRSWPRLLKNAQPGVALSTTTPSNFLKPNTHQTQPLPTTELDPRRRENSWIEVDVGWHKQPEGLNTHWQTYTKAGLQRYKDIAVVGGADEDVNKLLVSIVQNKCGGGKIHLGPFEHALALVDAWAPSSSVVRNQDDRLQGGGGVLRPGFKDRTLLLHAFMFPICAMLPETLKPNKAGGGHNKRDSAEHVSLQLQRCVLSNINDQNIRRELLLSADTSGMTSLIAASGSKHLASLQEYIQAVEMLTPLLTADEKKAWLCATTTDGCTALDSSLISGVVRSTKLLMTEYKTVLEDADRWLMYTTCNDRGATPLHQAMWFAHPHAIKELLLDMKRTAPTFKAFLNALTKPTQHGQTPLLLGLVRNDPDVLSAFVEAACVSTKSTSSTTSTPSMSTSSTTSTTSTTSESSSSNINEIEIANIEWLWEAFEQILIADENDTDDNDNDNDNCDDADYNDDENDDDGDDDDDDDDNDNDDDDDDADDDDGDDDDGTGTQAVVVEGLRMATRYSFEFKRVDHENDMQLIGQLLLIMAKQYRTSVAYKTTTSTPTTPAAPAPPTPTDQADEFSFFPLGVGVEPEVRAPQESEEWGGAQWDSLLLSSVAEVQHPAFMLSFVDMMKDIQQATLDCSDEKKTLNALEIDSSIRTPFLRAILEGDVQSASELFESLTNDTQRKYMEHIISDHKLLPSSPRVQLLAWIQSNAIASGVNTDQVLEWLLEGRLLNDIFRNGTVSVVKKCFDLLRVSHTTKNKSKSKSKNKNKTNTISIASPSGNMLRFALHHCAHLPSVDPFMSILEALRESYRTSSKEFQIMLGGSLPFLDGRGSVLKEMITAAHARTMAKRNRQSSATTTDRSTTDTVRATKYRHSPTHFEQQMTALLGKSQPKSLGDIIDPLLSYKMFFAQCKKGLSSLDYAVEKLSSPDLEIYLQILCEHAQEWTTPQLQLFLLHRDTYQKITPIQRFFQRKLETSAACIDLMSELVDDAQFDREHFYELSVPGAASAIAPLHDAARSGDTLMFTWFLSLVKRADLTSEQFQTWFSTKTETRHTALHQVLHSGTPAMVAEYLSVLHNAPVLDQKTYYELLTGENSYGYTPMHTAVSTGDPVSLQILIDELLQADLSADDLRETMTWVSRDGSTPLHVCFLHGNPETLEVYTSALKTVGLTKEAYHKLLTATNVNQQNLLHLALQQEDQDMLTALLGAVRDSLVTHDLLKDFLTAPDKHGQTPLHLACTRSWDVRLIQSLISAIQGFGDQTLATALNAETEFGKVPMRGPNKPFCDDVNALLQRTKATLPDTNFF